MVAGIAKTHKEYINEVKSIHKNNIKVLGKYVNDGVKILHQCKLKHTWYVRPNHVLRGIGCPNCAIVNRGLKRRKTMEDYVNQILKIHGKKIAVCDTYKGAFVKIRHKCNECSYTWKCTPDNITNSSKTGCPKCAIGKRHSNKAIRWLKEESKKRGIRIRHAENWGEYNIPGTRLRVDGFHKPTNTIFEFYGDKYHGNLKVFKPRSRPHPFSNKSAKSLYLETLAREKLLLDKGYSLVTMWESDYDKC